VARKRGRRLLIGLSIALAIYLAACIYLANAFMKPGHFVSHPLPGLTEVSVPTRGGPTPSFATPALASGHPSKTVFILAHGYHGNREGWAPIIFDLKRAGYDSLTPSMPGQDASPEGRVGFGVSEARTLVDSVKWAREHGAKHIILVGVSMGGAAAWLASEQDPTIDAVVTECAYARFDEAMDRWFDRKLPYAHIYLRPVVWYAAVVEGISPGKIRPVDAAAKRRGKPALVIQAGDDALIPATHAKQLADAAGCELWTVPGAPHAQCSAYDERGYIARLVQISRRVEQN